MFDNASFSARRQELDMSKSASFDAAISRPSMSQRTLKSAISCTGVGLHSGEKTSMTLNPAPVDFGIAFRRVDAAGKGAIIKARWDQVSDTRLNTCVANEDGVGVRTIEHLMAALAGAGIDNALIDIDGPEVPVMDGSAFPFLFLIDCAGTARQAAPRKGILIKKKVTVTDGDKAASLIPALKPSLRVAIDFPASVIGAQEISLPFSEDAFRRTISRARTFGFEQEVFAMRAAGLGRGASLENAILIAADGSNVVNEDGLRYEDEFVRHKLLDAVGDIYLAGAPILGAYSGYRPGHAMNNMLLRALFSDNDAWELIPMSDANAAMAGISTPELSVA